MPGTATVTEQDLAAKVEAKRRDLASTPAEESTPPSRSSQTPSRLGDAIRLPELTEAPCPACGTPVEAARWTIDGRVIAPLCVVCRAEEDVRAKEEADRERRAMLAESADQRRAEITQLLARCGVDAGAPHMTATLENFRPDPDRHALQAAREFVTRYRSGEAPNLYLYSFRGGEAVAPGCGKTHLAVAILRELLIAGDVDTSSAVFVRETRMTITLRRMIGSGERPEDYLDRLIRADLLVIDDVGKARTDTPWLRELMFELVAGREARSTIITSNYSLEQLEERDEYFATLASRIVAKGPPICLVGPDRRRLREGR